MSRLTRGWRQRSPVFTGRLVLFVLAIAALVALVPAPGSLFALVLVVAIMIAALVDWVLCIRPNRIDIAREAPSLLFLRQSGTIEWTITSPEKSRQVVSFADALMPSLHAGSRRFHVRVPANASVYVETTITPERRGRFDFDEVVVRTVGPLGLVGRQAKRSLPGSIKVYPAFDSRKQAELLIARARESEVGLRSVRGHGGGTEFEQLREYTIDDDFRRVDWAATVRTGKPIVRTFRAEQNQNVVILLDCGRVMAGQVNGIARLEYAMDAVMALSTVATRLGDRVGMIAFDSEIRSEVTARHGASHVARVTDAMYALEPRLVESDYRRAFTHALTRFRRRSLVVLFTELSQHAVAEALAPAMGIITNRHMLVVASVTDPDVSRWATALPVESSKAFRKAAAIDALEQRMRTVAQLRSRGATVIDGAPGQLAGRVADAYLKAKATSRL